jgi:demethylmenaquinone methyltransferase/2-methoxy-6-polyprenyl-1,4-benzoquinol methylase
MDQSADPLTEQVNYYRSRAGEYDDWFERRGRYDRGPAANRRWAEETAKLVLALDDCRPAGNVLELACGTGLFTRHLVRHAASVTAVDASPEVIEINRDRCHGAPVRYVEANLFSWSPHEAYDVVFFSFWLSHVPADRFDHFWATVRAALVSGGRAFFIDSLYNPESTAADHLLRGPEAETVRRRLNDGREFEIVKVFYDPDRLTERLADLGWSAKIHTTGDHFFYGTAVPT